MSGVTVNVGKITGGTRPNVVPERCELEVDVRATTAAVMSCALWVRSRTLPTRERRLSAFCRRRSGTRSSNSPLDPEETWDDTT